MDNRVKDLADAKTAAEAAWLAFEPNIDAYRAGLITADEYLLARAPLFAARQRLAAAKAKAKAKA